jgi:Ca2+:H+ antiporter
MEVVAVILTVVLSRMVAEDGESNWLEGALLLMIYAILAVAFYFLPAHRASRVDPPRAPRAVERPAGSAWRVQPADLVGAGYVARA